MHNVIIILLIITNMSLATRQQDFSEGGMIRLEALIELKFLDSRCSSSTLSIRAVRAYPLIEIRQAAPCRAIRGNSISVNSTLPPSQVCHRVMRNQTPSYYIRLIIVYHIIAYYIIVIIIAHHYVYVYIYIYIYIFHQRSHQPWTLY